jgi:hypothetical protein
VLKTLPREKSYVIFTGETLPLKTKQSGGKIIQNSDLRGRIISRGGITRQEKEEEYFVKNLEC